MALPLSDNLGVLVEEVHLSDVNLSGRVGVEHVAVVALHRDS